MLVESEPASPLDVPINTTRLNTVLTVLHAEIVRIHGPAPRGSGEGFRRFVRKTIEELLRQEALDQRQITLEFAARDEEKGTDAKN